MADEPHAARNFGRLNNGNRSGNPDNAPRCGARTRSGSACNGPAMANGKCRMHGGGSTGPRTPEGLKRSQRARWKHGRYSIETVQAMRELRAVIRYFRELDEECPS
jgi:hypothetical protein